MKTSVRWEEHLDALGPKQRETLLGTSLSRRFTTLPLWLSHPSNISAFYGFLVSLALLLPYRFGKEADGWFAAWLFQSALLMSACLLLGMISLIIVKISKRFPVPPPRYILYPMPFVGFSLLTLDRIQLFELPMELQTRTQQRVITLTATMSEADSDSGNNSNQIATGLDAGATIQVEGPSLMNVPSGGISTFAFKLENLELLMQGQQNSPYRCPRACR